MIGTFWSLVPAIVAIALALITKEVYSSLFIGILIGGAFYSGLSFTGFITHVFQDGMVAQLSDSWNVGILIFLVVLGIMVCLMNKAGGSAAFGNWAKKHIKSKVGAQIATICLGILIFIDDHHDSNTSKPNVSHDFSSGKGFSLGLHRSLLALSGSLCHRILGQLIRLRIFCCRFYHSIRNVLHRGGDALGLGNWCIQQTQQGYRRWQGHRGRGAGLLPKGCQVLL